MMGGLGSLVGTIALTDIGSPAAGLGAGARPVAGPITGTRSVARFVTSTRSVAGLGAGVEHLLAATAAKIALTAISGGLTMIDSRLPFIAAAGDRMGRAIARRSDVDVVAAATPVNVAAPITS